jgi:hypothetical protein
MLDNYGCVQTGKGRENTSIPEKSVCIFFLKKLRVCSLREAGIDGYPLK